MPADGPAELRDPVAPAPIAPPPAPPAAPAAPVKFGRILDRAGGSFGLEYDNHRGQTSMMSLEACTYEGAIREARSFLGIQDDDLDEDGARWTVE